MTDFFTYMAGHNHNGAPVLSSKEWTPTEVKTGGKAYWFASNQWPVTDIRALADVLDKTRNKPDFQIIRGKAVEGLDTKELHRRLSAPDQDDPATYEECPHHWLMIDFDDIDIRGTMVDPIEDPEHAAQWLVDLLPVEFCDVSYYWHFSASTGHHSKMRDGVVEFLSAHLWFWLDRPVGNEELKRWAVDVRSKGVRVDGSLYTPVQPHFCADPIIPSTMRDPMPVRAGFVELERDEVAIAIPEHTQRAYSTAGAPWMGPDRSDWDVSSKYEEAIAAIGIDGYHEETKHAIGVYITHSGIDTEPLLRDLTDAHLNNPQGRPAKEIDRKIRELPKMIEWTVHQQREAEKKDAQRFDENGDILAPELIPEHFIMDEVTLSDATGHLFDTLHNTLNAARTGGESAPVIGMGITPGVGKTHTAIGRGLFESATEHSIRYFGPSNSLADEKRGETLELADEIIGQRFDEEDHLSEVEQWVVDAGRRPRLSTSASSLTRNDLTGARDRLYHKRGFGPESCLNWKGFGEKFEGAASNPASTLCKACPMAEQCKAKGFLNGQEYKPHSFGFAPHNYLFTPMSLKEGKEGYAPSRYIIDENFLAAGTPIHHRVFSGILGEHENSAARVRYKGENADLWEVRQDILKSLAECFTNGRRAPLQSVKRRISSGDIKAVLEVEQTRVKVTAAHGSDEYEKQLKLSKHLGFPDRAVIDLLKSLKAQLRRQGYWLKGIEMSEDDEGRRVIHICRRQDMDGIHPGSAVVLLDATMHEEITKRFFPSIKTERIDVERPHASIIQVRDKTYSKHSIIPDADQKRTNKRGKNDTAAEMAKRELDTVRGVINGAIEAGQQVGLITYQEIEGEFAAEIKAGCKFGYFGGVVGSNAFKDCDLLIILGRLEPKIIDLELQAGGLTYDEDGDIKYIQPDETGQYRLVSAPRRFVRKNGEVMGTMVSDHPDPVCSVILQTVREDGILQTAERARAVRATEEKPKTVLLMTNIPVRMKIDAHISASQLRAAQDRGQLLRADEIFSVNGGGRFLPMTPAALVGAGAYEKTTQAKEFIKRMKERPEPQMLFSGAAMIPVRRIEYRYAGQRGGNPAWGYYWTHEDDATEVARYLQPIIGAEIISVTLH